MEPNGGGAPRPDLAVQVGVTGHRDLPAADESGLVVLARTVFASLGDAMRQAHAADRRSGAPAFSSQSPALRCVCGLAEGADWLLAEAALAEGWQLVAALPFERRVYAEDFGPRAARYWALLARARMVCELDGARGCGAEPYARLGAHIVGQSDMLLAVWDGLPARGPGGAGDVVAAALAARLPVAVLSVVGRPRLTWRGEAGVGAVVRRVTSVPE